MADLVAMDLVPEPTILAAALRACRRVNDYSLTTRILEITKIKCGDKEAEFWPYIMQVTWSHHKGNDTMMKDDAICHKMIFLQCLIKVVFS